MMPQDEAHRCDALQKVRHTSSTQEEWTPQDVALLHAGEAPAGLAQSLAGVTLRDTTLPNNDAVAPLILHALHAGDARFLLQWATRPVNELRMNVLSRRGLNANVASEWIGASAAAQLAECISGTQTLFDAINAPFKGAIAGRYNAQRFIAAHALLLSLASVPALDAREFEQPAMAKVLPLIRSRAGHAAFHPSSTQRALTTASPAAFTLFRSSPDGRAALISLVNCSDAGQLVSIPWRKLLGTNNAVKDLVNGARINVHGPSLELAPYEARWLVN
jgi:hypothetical protein